MITATITKYFGEGNLWKYRTKTHFNLIQPTLSFSLTRARGNHLRSWQRELHKALVELRGLGRERERERERERGRGEGQKKKLMFTRNNEWWKILKAPTNSIFAYNVRMSPIEHLKNTSIYRSKGQHFTSSTQAQRLLLQSQNISMNLWKYKTKTHFHWHSLHYHLCTSVCLKLFNSMVWYTEFTLNIRKAELI